MRGLVHPERVILYQVSPVALGIRAHFEVALLRRHHLLVDQLLLAGTVSLIDQFAFITADLVAGGVAE